MRRRVTFSRNLTLSLSRTCRCYCKYCAFATHQAHLHPPEEVLEILDGASRRRVKELLVLTGERPEVNPRVREMLVEYGHEDFTAYVVWVCERALERGLLPHTNLGVLTRDDLARLREVTASQGLMLESISERLMQTVHAGSPTKHPRRRLETIRAAGELRIPFTSGILVGIGETEQERMDSLAALAEVHREHGHLQEIILQNFVPHQRYYGKEPAEIADAAAQEYWRTGVSDGRPHLPAPDGALEGAGPVGIEDMKRLISECRRLMPGVGIQVPPNLELHPFGRPSWCPVRVTHDLPSVTCVVAPRGWKVGKGASAIAQLASQPIAQLGPVPTSPGRCSTSLSLLHARCLARYPVLASRASGQVLWRTFTVD